MPEVTTEGKPRLYFLPNAADKSWRLKEKIAAVIESYFQRLDDLYVFSPKRIKTYMVSSPGLQNVNEPLQPDAEGMWRQ